MDILIILVVYILACIFVPIMVSLVEQCNPLILISVLILGIILLVYVKINKAERCAYCKKKLKNCDVVEDYKVAQYFGFKFYVCMECVPKYISSWEKGNEYRKIHLDKRSKKVII